MTTESTLLPSMGTGNSANLAVPLLVITLLAMMILPLPSFMLDVFFTFNIALSLVVLLVSVYANRPLDFSVFPTVLLVSTLLRLSLNVASTRVVLMYGHTGADAAGQVIKSFGSVVIGNNYAIGIVVFAILVIINFVVVTKGSGRISEVSARFTLDAMPGKQMAIDADLNAGVISQEEAKARRSEVSQEADFYGAMDGASKFVRGDAIAGLLILFINIIGGLIIGMTQYHMSLGDASHNYVLLTIGDGLVAQIPSLLLSTAAAIMVTRINSDEDMNQLVFGQMFNKPKVLYVCASIIGLLGLIPGMPHFAFLSLAILAGVMANFVQASHAQPQENTAMAQLSVEPSPIKEKELDWDDVDQVDTLGLEIGYRLINLVDENKGGQLMRRIKGIRKKISQDLGFLIPSIHIKDNLKLAANHYRIHLMGVVVGEAEIHPDKELAINPGSVFGEISGIVTRDPTFQLEAKWIEPGQRDHAQSLGYTVVDPSTVIATHLSQILQEHAAELIGHEEVQQLLDRLSKTAPKLVEALTPGALQLGVIVKVLQRLLEEKVPITNLRCVAECLVEHASQSQDPDLLTTAVRQRLRRQLVQTIAGNQKELAVMTLAPELEQILQKSAQMASNTGIGVEPSMAEKLYRALMQFTQQQQAANQAAILLVTPSVRASLARFVRHSISGLHVLSYQEIPDDKQIKIIGSIG